MYLYNENEKKKNNNKKKTLATVRLYFPRRMTIERNKKWHLKIMRTNPNNGDLLKFRTKDSIRFDFMVAFVLKIKSWSESSQTSWHFMMKMETVPKLVSLQISFAFDVTVCPINLIKNGVFSCRSNKKKGLFATLVICVWFFTSGHLFIVDGCLRMIDTATDLFIWLHRQRKRWNYNNSNNNNNTNHRLNHWFSHFDFN